MPWLWHTAPVLHSAAVITEVFLPSSMVGYIVCRYSSLKRDYPISQNDRSLALDLAFSISNYPPCNVYPLSAKARHEFEMKEYYLNFGSELHVRGVLFDFGPLALIHRPSAFNRIHETKDHAAGGRMHLDASTPTGRRGAIFLQVLATDIAICHKLPARSIVTFREGASVSCVWNGCQSTLADNSVCRDNFRFT
ncbi:hypothetical protein BDW69DRAFT_16569 [Aspergillus filifer]